MLAEVVKEDAASLYSLLIIVKAIQVFIGHLSDGNTLYAIQCLFKGTVLKVAKMESHRHLMFRFLNGF